MQFRVKEENKVMNPVLTFVEIVGKLHFVVSDAKFYLLEDMSYFGCKTKSKITVLISGLKNR